MVRVLFFLGVVFSCWCVSGGEARGKVHELPGGGRIVTYPDGRQVVTYKNGTQVTSYISDPAVPVIPVAQIVVHPDGRKFVIVPEDRDGNWLVIHPDGIRFVIHPDNLQVGQYRDGRVSYDPEGQWIYPSPRRGADHPEDGIEATRHPDGRWVYDFSHDHQVIDHPDGSTTVVRKYYRTHYRKYKRTPGYETTYKLNRVVYQHTSGRVVYEFLDDYKDIQYKVVKYPNGRYRFEFPEGGNIEMHPDDDLKQPPEDTYP